MFADSPLAARIDRAEARLCAEYASGEKPRADGRGSFVLPLSGGLAIYAAPRSPINKVIGIGFDMPLDLEVLSQIEARWRERDEPVRIELSILTEPEIAQALSARGYRLHGFENVLGRPVGDDDRKSSGSGISISVVGEDNTRTWVEVVVDSFANMDGTGSAADEELPREQLEEMMGSYEAVRNLTRYLAFVDGQPAGEAAMRIDDNLAQMAGSGTLPRFRGRGVQKALIQRRLSDARAAGCELAVVVTAPGTRSQDNVMRRGFALLYTRAILVRDWPKTGGEHSVPAS